MLELGTLNEAWQRPLGAHAAFNMAANVRPIAFKPCPAARGLYISS